MPYRIAADAVLVIHLAFILFILLGGIAVLRRPGLAWLHVPAVAWGVLVEAMGWICPLTPWESELRRAAGGEGYSGGFVEHYIVPVIYPPGLTREVQIVLALVLVLVNAGIYARLIYRWRLRRD